LIRYIVIKEPNVFLHRILQKEMLLRKIWDFALHVNFSFDTFEVSHKHLKKWTTAWVFFTDES
jgi:hypothetical protein